MAVYRFVGADPRDYFALGRVAPGDEHDLDEPPADGCWEPAKRGAGAPLAANPGPIPTDLRPAAARPAQKD